MIRYSTTVFIGLASTILRLVFIAFLSHHLPIDAFADYVYLYSTALMLSLLSDFGLRSSLFVEIGRNDGISNEKLSELFGARVVFGSMAFAVTFIWGLIYISKHGLSGSAILAAALFGIFAANTANADLSLHVLRGYGSATKESIIKFCEVFAGACIAVLLTRVGLSSVFVVTGLIVAGLARALFTHNRVFSKRQAVSFQVSMSLVRQFIREQWVRVALILSHTLSVRYIILVSPLFLLDADVAYCGVLIMMTQTTQTFSTTFAFLSFGKSKDKVKFCRKQLIRCTFFLFCLGLMGSASMWLLGDVLGGFLNVDFRESSTAFTLAALCIPAILVNDLMRFVFVYSGQESRYASIALATTIACVTIGVTAHLCSVDIDKTLLFSIFFVGQISQACMNTIAATVSFAHDPVPEGCTQA